MTGLPLDASQPTQGVFSVESLVLHIYLTVDLGSLVDDRGSTTVLERGRVTWLDDVLSGLGSAGTMGPAFVDARRVDSAYARTDRFGRSTLSEGSQGAGMPVQIRLADNAPRFAGVLQWKPQDVEVGPSGAMSLHVSAGLATTPVSDVSEIVKAYHVVRREVESLFTSVLASFCSVWNSKEQLSNLFKMTADVSKISPCLVFDVLDFDFRIDGNELPPKVLYQSPHVDALRALAGLTRMSSVYSSYDEASVRALNQLDIGSRSDELWIVNESRLVRRHPERGMNPYVDAFFEDVCTGIRMLVERASSLIFLMQWMNTSQSEILHELSRAQNSTQSIDTMKQLLNVLIEMGYLISDPAHIEDTSGHSFFRTVMGRTSERLALDTRRHQIHDGFIDLLSLSQALSGQAVANGAEILQRESLQVARSSRFWAVLAVFFAVVALLVSGLQLFFPAEGRNSNSGQTAVRSGQSTGRPAAPPSVGVTTVNGTGEGVAP